MTGISSAFSRLVRRRVDDVALVDVFITPLPARWGYVPQPPFRLVHIDLDDGAVYALERYADIGDALWAFADRHRPYEGTAAGIVDGHDQMILAWIDRDDDNSEYRYRWFGCQLAFEYLALCEIEEGWAVKVALWETQARSQEVSGR